MISELKTVREAHGLVMGDFNGDGLSDLATFSDNQVFLHLQTRDTTRWATLPVRFEDKIAHVIAARCHKSRQSDLIMITENPVRLQVYLAQPDLSFPQRWRANMDQPFENISTGDINNDGKIDLLLFGKKEPGITIYLGNDNGTFRPPTTILSDYTFSSVSVEDMNEDGINDILAINWISNEVLMFSGFGKMKFSNPSTLSFQDEPTQVATAFLDSGSTRDIIVGFSQSREVRTFSGNGYGAFTPLQTIPLEFNTSQIAAADFNDDGKQDILVFSQEQKSVDVLLNNGIGQLEPSSLFAAGKAPAEFSIFYDAYRSYPDIAILDKDRSFLRLLQNSNVRAARTKQVSYCLGLLPAGILVSDLNHDGWPDILVANSGSQQLSVLTNYGDGTFDGEVSFPCPFSTSSLLYCLQNDTLSKVLATNGNQDKISITDINAKDYSFLSYTLTASLQPDVLLATMSREDAFLTVFNLEATELPHGISLMKFQQISSTRFVEQSYSIQAGSQAIAAAVGDYDGDRAIDLAYLSLNKRQKKVELYQAKGTTSADFMNPRLAFKLDAPDSLDAYMWNADLNKDSISDLVILLRSPKNMLFTSLGRRDTTFGPPHVDTTYAVDVFSKDRLKFFDLNADGNIDMILDNSLTKTIQVYFGNGDGTFSKAVRLINSEGVGGFAVEDLNKDAIPELIVTDRVNGVLKIVSLE